MHPLGIVGCHRSIIVAITACMTFVAAGQPQRAPSIPESTFIGDDSVLLLDGRTVAISDLVLKSCAAHPSCLWTDATDTPVQPLGSQVGWDGPGPALPPGQASWRAGFPSAVDVSDAIAHAFRANQPGHDEDGPEPRRSRANGPKRLHDGRHLGLEGIASEPSPALDVPVFVLNHPSSSNQTNSMETMIRAAGFLGLVSFLPIEEESDIDLQYLEQTGTLDQGAVERITLSTWITKESVARHVSIALGHLAAIREGLKRGDSHFAVFEDNLMLAAHPTVMRDRLSSALRSVPETADMLFLEGSFEKCKERKYSRAHMYWARTEGPARSGAIIFTRKGAHRMLELARKIFWGINDMYLAAIRSHLIEAYIILPLAFFRDEYWVANHWPATNRISKPDYDKPAYGEKRYRPFALLCMEQQNNELALTVAQTSTQTEFSTLAHFQGTDPSCSFNSSLIGLHSRWSGSSGKLLLISDILPPNGIINPWMWLEYWTIKINEDNNEEIGEDDIGTWIRVGRWHQSCRVKGVVLNINRFSACFDLLELGECTIKVIGETDFGETGSRVVELSSLLHVHQNIFSEYDILDRAFHPKTGTPSSFELNTSLQSSPVEQTNPADGTYNPAQESCNYTWIYSILKNKYLLLTAVESWQSDLNCTSSSFLEKSHSVDQICNAEALTFDQKPNISYIYEVPAISERDLGQGGSAECYEDCQVTRAAVRIFNIVGDWVILILIDQGSITLTQSWLCNTQSMPGIWERVLLVSTDSKATKELAAWNPRLNIAHWDIGDESEDYYQESNFGDIQFFRVHQLNRRLLLLINLLSAGVNIIIAESDAVWTSDPLQTLPSKYHGTDSRQWDIAATWDFSIRLTGFAFVRATEASIEAFSNIFAVYSSLMQSDHDYDDRSVAVWKRKYEGLVLRDYIRLHRLEIRIVYLDPDLHVRGMWYSDVSFIQSCTVPVTIKNDWIVGNEGKIFRLKQLGNWFLAEKETICVGNNPEKIFQNVFKRLSCRYSPFVGLCGLGCIGTKDHGCIWTRELSKHSVVYSIVTGVDLSFEVGLAARYGVTVHLFDPECKFQESFSGIREILSLNNTNRSIGIHTLHLADYKEMVRASTIQAEQLQYHANCPTSLSHSVFTSCQLLNTASRWTGIAPLPSKACSSWQDISFSNIMIELGHSKVDLLKFDANTVDSQAIDMGTMKPKFVIMKNSNKDDQFSQLVGEYQIVAANDLHITLEKNPRTFQSSPSCKSQCSLDCLCSIRVSIGGHFISARTASTNNTNISESRYPCTFQHAICRVTEPFIVQENKDEWYLFARWTEGSQSGKGKVAIFRSTDRLHTFSQGQTVLEELWGIGRPFVVKDNSSGWHYMLTNIEDVLQGQKVLWLYESAAADWPFRWKRKRRILHENNVLGRPLNPVLFFHSEDSTWYLLVFDEGLGMERLFFSERLDVGFIQHPKSGEPMSGQHVRHLHVGPVVMDEDDPNKSIWTFLKTRDTAKDRDSITVRRIVKLNHEEFEYSSSMLPIAVEGTINDGWNLQGQKSFSVCRIGVRQWVVASDQWFDLSALEEGRDFCQASSSCTGAPLIVDTLINRMYTDRDHPYPTAFRFGIYKSFYINLEHRSDRKLMIEGVLRFSRIPFERIEAVDGRKGENSHMVEDCYDSEYCPGHVGCQHSHMKAVQAAINSNLEYVAIFEDDFMFKPTVDQGWIHTAVQRVMDLVPEWDVIGLLHNIKQKEPFAVMEVKWSESFSSKIVRIHEAATATGYIARRSILPHLLNTFHPSNCEVTRDRSVAIDQCWKSLQKQFTWIGFEPQPGAHNDTFSDIEGWFAQYKFD